MELKEATTMNKDAHHAGDNIEYLTCEKHSKRHGDRPQWLVGRDGSWRRDKKRRALAEDSKKRRAYRKLLKGFSWFTKGAGR